MCLKISYCFVLVLTFLILILNYQSIKLSNGGGLTRILTELEESNFIRKYRSLSKILKKI